MSTEGLTEIELALADFCGLERFTPGIKTDQIQSAAFGSETRSRWH